MPSRLLGALVPQRVLSSGGRQEQPKGGGTLRRDEHRYLESMNSFILPLSIVATITPSGDGAPVSFYAMGDVPYNDVEACLIPHELGKLSPSGGKFVVHLGDTKDTKQTPCPESLHEDIARIFESSPLPVFSVIGDNEWLDCGGGDSAAEDSYGWWIEHLGRFYERGDLGWPALGVDVEHHPSRPELFRFLLEDVLFVGLGLPSPIAKNLPADWEEYMDTNARWTDDNIAANKGNIKAAVLLAHMGYTNRARTKPYLDKLVRDIAPSHANIPILLLGDGHSFIEEMPTRNVYWIKLDDTVTPVRITVDTSKGGGIRGIFRHDRRCPCTTGHDLPRDLVKGSGDCRNECYANGACMSGIPIPLRDPTAPAPRPTPKPSRDRTPRPTRRRKPARQPTPKPARKPSSEPTSEPTKTPTLAPTTEPTFVPSFEPTSRSSYEPTSHPSYKPTSHPSYEPTSHPSCEPTSRPSDEPTSRPSFSPSFPPSGQPSSHPSVRPSKRPSAQSSSQPSSQPSFRPSSQPSNHPSIQDITPKIDGSTGLLGVNNVKNGASEIDGSTGLLAVNNVKNGASAAPSILVSLISLAALALYSGVM